MHLLRKLKIGKRLSISFGFFLLLILLQGGANIFQTNRIGSFTKDITQNWLPSIKILGEIRNSFSDVRRVTLRHLLEDSKTEKEVQKNRRTVLIEQRIPELFLKYEKTITSNEELNLWGETKKLWNEYLEQDNILFDLSEGDNSNLNTIRSATSDSSTAFTAVMDLLDKEIALNDSGASKLAMESESTISNEIYLVIASATIAIVLGMILSKYITDSIVKPLNNAIETAEAIASGDLSTNISVEGQDDLTDLLRSMQKMNNNLGSLVKQVRSSSSNIAHGSREIAAGNSDLSHRTEEQASNLEETAAAMEELISTVQSNSEAAAQANRLAFKASGAATKGGSVVEQVVQNMRQIQDASHSISDIIGIIDGIAFQTNILALNAAVEAARAGGHGRGFAVVATEVRSLAQRSANAAKEIKSLISDSVEKVDAGTRLADEAVKSMNEIVSQVNELDSLINAISNASSEQSSGISQVGDAVNQLDQVTQQNAALVEQSAAAADSLSAQALRLVEIVEIFTLPKTDNVISSEIQLASGNKLDFLQGKTF